LVCWPKRLLLLAIVPVAQLKLIHIKKSFFQGGYPHKYVGKILINKWLIQIWMVNFNQSFQPRHARQKILSAQVV
jgi:hypothetical protein